MARILVLYYSGYGHVEAMAAAVAEGAASVAGCTCDVRRVPELVPAEVAAASGMKVDQAAPVAAVDDLPSYDAIIFGTPTRFGNGRFAVLAMRKSRPLRQAAACTGDAVLHRRVDLLLDCAVLCPAGGHGLAPC